MSNNCFCLRTTRCFCISNSSLFIMSSLSWMVASLSPSSKRRCLNFSVETTMLSTAGPISSALDTRGNMSLTAFNASNHDALSSLLSALKCSLFFVPVYTENLLSSDLLSLIEHTLRCISPTGLRRRDWVRLFLERRRNDSSPITTDPRSVS